MAGQAVAASPAPSSPSADDIARGGFGRRAAHGFAWNLTASVIVKLILLVGQIVIAWYLTRAQMGLAAIAISAMLLPAQIKEFGIPQLLLRHPRRFKQWSTDAAWLLTALGLIATIVTALAAPIVARVENSPPVVGLMALAGLNIVLSGANAVSFVRLSIELRFRLLARVATIAVLFSMALSVLMAMRGFGPYAIIIPLVATSALRLAIASWLSPIQWTLWPRAWSRCTVMLGDGWRMFVGSIFFTVVWQGDNLILGSWHGQEQVGIYNIAFQLSLQGLALLTDNLAGVLMPVMGHMTGDSARQREGFLRALRYLCFIGVPLCFIQGALAEPLLRLFWHDKWVAATHPLQALCIGMAFQLVGLPSMQFLLAQGRLGTFMKTSALSAVGLVIAVTCAVQFGAATSVAVAVAGIYLIMNACIASAALGKRGSGIPLMLSGLPDVARVMAAPLLSGLIGGMVGYEVGQWTMHHQGPLLALIAGGSAGLAASILVIAAVSRELSRGLIGLIRSLINRQPAS